MRVLLAMLLACCTGFVSAEPLPPQQQTSAAADDSGALEAQRRADWILVREARMQPLSVPQSENAQAWRRYTVELAGRLSDDGDSIGYWQLTMLDESASSDADAIRTKIREMAESGNRTPDLSLFAAPDTRRLATVIAAALAQVAPASMQGDTLVFVGAPEHRMLLDAAARRAGVTLQFVDASAPYPGKVMPDAVPDWFDGPRY